MDTPIIGNAFYLPHRPGIQEIGESTKVRIVFDAQARSITSNHCLSLNDVMEVRSALQMFGC